MTLNTVLLASLCGFVSLVIGLVLVPLIRRMAIRVGVVDSPDPTRKLHDGVISLGGGLAVFLASLVGVFAAVTVGFRYVPLSDITIDSKWSLLLLASGLMVLLGLIDDWVTLRGRQKLLGQIVIVLLMVGGGTVVEQIDVMGYNVQLGIFALPITMLWLLGAVNALNLIDGADGIASTTGSIICAGLAVMAFSRGQMVEGCVAIALSMSLLAFLKYNKPPATIFLGDSGSMLIGLVVGTLAVWTSTKESTAIAAIIPIAVLAVPLFDSTIAILRRVLTGRSIYAADRAHMHHVLQAYLNRKGYPQIWMLVVVAILTLIPVGGAVASVLLMQPLIAVLATGFVLGGMVATKSFGHAELALLAKRSASFGSSLLTRSGKADGIVRHTSVRLQGSRGWDIAWSSLVDFAEHHDLSRIKLDLNVCWLHEGFHGDWQKARMPDRAEQWNLKLPVEIDGRQVGHMEVVGRGGDTSTYQLLETLLELMTELHPTLRKLVSDDPRVADEVVSSDTQGFGSETVVDMPVPSAASTS